MYNQTPFWDTKSWVNNAKMEKITEFYFNGTPVTGGGNPALKISGTSRTLPNLDYLCNSDISCIFPINYVLI